MTNPRYHVLLNARSGSAGDDAAARVRAALAAHGHAATIDDDDGAPFAERLRRAAASPAEVIVAAGGDGTATAVAAAILGTGKTLAVLPLGTANLLARDLRLPLEVDAWAAALDGMAVRRIDVGEVNGRTFLHNVVVGTIPGIAESREEARGSLGLRARLAFLSDLVGRLDRARPLAVELTTSGGDRRVERVRSIAVANNDYDEGVGRLFARSRLDAGALSLHLFRRLSAGVALRLWARMALGDWRKDEAIEIRSVRSLAVRVKRPTLKVMIDGEVEILDVPLEFRIRPGALAVLAPAEAADAPADAPKAAAGG